MSCICRAENRFPEELFARIMLFLNGNQSCYGFKLLREKGSLFSLLLPHKRACKTQCRHRETLVLHDNYIKHMVSYIRGSLSEKVQSGSRKGVAWREITDIHKISLQSLTISPISVNKTSTIRCFLNIIFVWPWVVLCMTLRGKIVDLQHIWPFCHLIP